MKFGALLNSGLPLMLALMPLGCSTIEILDAPRAPAVRAIHADNDVETPADGEAQITIDVDHGTARVEEVIDQSSATTVGRAMTYNGIAVETSSSYFAERTRPVCETPCVAVLSRGWHALRITDVAEPLATGVTNVDLKRKPQAMIYEMAEYRPPSRVGFQFAGLFESLGVVSAAMGGIGLGVSQVEPSKFVPRPDDYFTPSLAMVGAGLTSLALGIVIHVLSRGSFRPGVSTTYTDPR